MTQFLFHFTSVYLNTGVIIGLIIEILLFLLIAFGYKKFKKSSFIVFFELVFEKVYEFFESIMGEEEKKWTKLYITVLFFVILISNLLGVFLDLLLPIFGENMEHFIKIPTADINFNVAMAIIGVIIIIFEQFRFLGFKKAAYEYVPFLGKNYIPYERGKLNKCIDLPLFLIVKIFDIIISLFLGLLEIVGHFAKIISLSFRLFGNVTSGGLLLVMLVGGLSSITLGTLGFEFPILGPVIIYLQGLLVAFIQALVFPLLVAIFIKVAKVH